MNSDLHAAAILPPPWRWSGWGRGAGRSASPLRVVAQLKLLQLSEVLIQDGSALFLEVLTLRFESGLLPSLLLPAALNVLAQC